MPTDVPTPRQGTAFDKRYAYAFLTALFVLPILALAGAVAIGWVSFEVTATGTLDLTTPLWYISLAVAGAFIIMIYVALSRVAGPNFMAALARLADSYSLPEREDGDE